MCCCDRSGLELTNPLSGRIDSKITRTAIKISSSEAWNHSVLLLEPSQTISSPWIFLVERGSFSMLWSSPQMLEKEPGSQPRSPRLFSGIQPLEPSRLPACPRVRVGRTLGLNTGGSAPGCEMHTLQLRFLLLSQMTTPISACAWPRVVVATPGKAMV